jgi:hypothetical protein
MCGLKGLGNLISGGKYNEGFLADKAAHFSDNFSNPKYGFLLKDVKKLLQHFLSKPKSSHWVWG